MPRIRYHVAASLDGYIAGPRGEFDWIVHEPAIDFKALFAEFDTFVVGRRTFELMLRPDAPPRSNRRRTSGCSAEGSCFVASSKPDWWTQWKWL